MHPLVEAPYIFWNISIRLLFKMYENNCTRCQGNIRKSNLRLHSTLWTQIKVQFKRLVTSCSGYTLENKFLHNSGTTSSFCSYMLHLWTILLHQENSDWNLVSRNAGTVPYAPAAARHWGSRHPILAAWSSVALSLQGHAFPWCHIPQNMG